MKIINRDEFLKLERPTIFSKVDVSNGQHIIDNELNIFYPSLYSNDFELMPLNIEYNIDSDDALDCFHKIESLQCNLSFDSVMRDGLFEGDIKFAIFEKDDLIRFKNLIDSLV